MAESDKKTINETEEIPKSLYSTSMSIAHTKLVGATPLINVTIIKIKTTNLLSINAYLLSKFN